MFRLVILSWTNALLLVSFFSCEGSRVGSEETEHITLTENTEMPVVEEKEVPRPLKDTIQLEEPDDTTGEVQIELLKPENPPTENLVPGKEVPESKKKEEKKSPKKKKRAQIRFESTSYEFGRIKEGTKIDHVFKFKNIGDAPLVIRQVDVSCGCTFPSYPFLPIEPGATGEIGVTFNSEHKLGRQKPTVTVVTNGNPKKIILNLEGFVE